MKIEDVIPAFKAGKEIRIKSWNKYVVFRNDQSSFDFTLEDMFSSDWEIVEECQHKKVMSVSILGNQPINVCVYCGIPPESTEPKKEEDAKKRYQELENQMYGSNPKTKTVWQWRYLRDCGTWQIFFSLYTEKEAGCEFLNYRYEKHSGPYEVSDE